MGVPFLREHTFIGKSLVWINDRSYLKMPSVFQILGSVNRKQTEDILIPNTLLLMPVIYSIYILHVSWNVLYIYYIK